MGVVHTDRPRPRSLPPPPNTDKSTHGPTDPHTDRPPPPPHTHTHNADPNIDPHTDRPIYRPTHRRQTYIQTDLHPHPHPHPTPTHTFRGPPRNTPKPQALVYDILPSRKVPESGARRVVTPPPPPPPTLPFLSHLFPAPRWV